jgi:YVTN family beta-propeller protein
MMQRINQRRQSRETKMRSIFRRAVLITAALGACAAAVISGTTPNSNANTGLLLVVNKGNRTLSIVDPEAGRQLAAVPVKGITGHEVAASPDGRTAWVPIYGDSGVGRPGSDGRTISVVDLNTRSVIASIDLGAPTRPHGAVFGPTDGRLYVTAELTRSIKVIDPTTRKVVDSIPTGEPESHMLVISSDGKRGYTSNVGAGTISAIDLRSKKVLAVIPVSRIVQRIAISTDDHWVFTADQTTPQVVIIDTQTNTVKRRFPLTDVGFGMTPTHDGRRLLITHPSSDSVSVLDLHSMKVDQVIHTPASPQEILIRPDDQVAYISCDQSKQIAVVNLRSLQIERLIDVGAGADGLAWAPAIRQ